MKSFKINLFLMLLILINLFFVLYAQGEDLSEYYPLKEANIWEYEVEQEGATNVGKVKIDKKEYVNNVETAVFIYSEDDEEEGYEYIGMDSEGIKLYKEFDIDDKRFLLYAPPKILLPFNTKATQKYEYSYSGYDNEGNLVTDLSGKGNIEIKFEAEEDVVVAAEKFPNCIRILRSNFWNHNNGSFAKEKSIIWFAKGVGKVKEISEEIGFDAEEGRTYTDIEEYELKEAVVNGIEYGKED